MIKDITFGQYFVANSVLHRLDPRLKIVQLILLVVMLFVCDGFISLSLFGAFIFVILFSSKVPIRTCFKNVKVIIPIIIFTAILNLVYTRSGTEFVIFNTFSLYSGGIEKAVFMSVRILLLILLSSVLTYTTTPNDITDAIERLLSPLKFVGLGSAVHTISMMMTIAMRFIPTLIDETDKIMSAQKARGADLESGGLIKRIKALLPILIPLLISSVRRAYELAEAMECRCYNGGKGRTRMKQMKLNFTDYLSLVLSIIISISIIFTNYLF